MRTWYASSRRKAVRTLTSPPITVVRAAKRLLCPPVRLRLPAPTSARIYWIYNISGNCMQIYATFTCNPVRVVSKYCCSNPREQRPRSPAPFPKSSTSRDRGHYRRLRWPASPIWAMTAARNPVQTARMGHPRWRRPGHSPYPIRLSAPLVPPCPPVRLRRPAASRAGCLSHSRAAEWLWCTAGNRRA
jgi:hypothetical protein